MRVLEKKKVTKGNKNQQIPTFSLATALAMLYTTLSSFGAGLSASRRAWERVSLHELR